MSLIDPSTNAIYEFSSNKTDFTVVGFTGKEAISSLYEFEIILIKDASTSIRISDHIAAPAEFAINNLNGTTKTFHGILSEFEIQKTIQKRINSGNLIKVVVYKARLVPKFWKLTLLNNSRVFVDANQTVKTIIEKVLKTGNNLLDNDFNTDALEDRYAVSDSLITRQQDLQTQKAAAISRNDKAEEKRLTLLLNAVIGNINQEKKYKQRDFVCQYEESDFDFISRWCEREGISYYFKQENDKAVLVFSCLNTNFSDLNTTISYDPDNLSTGEKITSFVNRQKLIPEKIILRDYHSGNGKMITVLKDVDTAKGMGKKYIYGEYFDTEEEAERLAKYRAENLLTQKEEFDGESLSPRLSAGYIFTLSNHDTTALNNKNYIITEVSHAGHQTSFLTAGLGSEFSEYDEQEEYINTFKAMPDTTAFHFRTSLKTDKPQIKGTLQATVDGELTGDIAEIDSFGRYKIIFPFDIEDPNSGKASAFIRMAQPYAGHYVNDQSNDAVPSAEGSHQKWPVSNTAAQGVSEVSHQYGMHFPLHKGTEVLLSFIDGNPDRPIIVGALPNTSTKSPVQEDNQTQSVVRDHFGNELIFESKTGEEEIILKSPKKTSWLKLGKDGAQLRTDGDETKKIIGEIIGLGTGAKTEIFLGSSAEAKLAMAYELAVGQAIEIFCGQKLELGLGISAEFKKFKDYAAVEGDKKTEASKDHILTAGDGICIAGGMTQERKPRPFFMPLWKKPDVVSADDINSSIINAYRNGIVMSYGKRSSETESNIMTWVDWVTFSVFLATGLVTAIIAKAGEFAKEDDENYVFMEHPASLVTTIVAGIQAFYSSISAIANNDKEEPDFHNVADINSLISINKKGIKIGSGLSVKANQQAAATALATSGDDAWKKNLDFAVNPAKTELNSKIHVGNDGKIVIRTKDQSINLTIGGPTDPEAVIALDKTKENIELKYGKAHITMEKAGNISIDSETNITINGKQEVKIMNGAKEGFKFSGGKATILENTFTMEKKGFRTKYFKFLA